MFWLSEKIAGVFYSLFGKSDSQGLSPQYRSTLESLDFVKEVSNLGKTYSVLTNQTSKSGLPIHLYLSDDGKTLHDGGQVLTNTSELVLETQVAPNLPQNIKIVDGYLVNDSLFGDAELDWTEIRGMLNVIKTY